MSDALVAPPTAGAVLKSQSILLAPKALAEELDVTVKSLEKWRWLGTGPRFVKIGRYVRYRREDVDAWLNGRVVTTAREGRALASQGVAI